MSNDMINFLKVLSALDYLFNFIFIFEFSVKIIAYGFILDYESYLRDSWS